MHTQWILVLALIAEMFAVILVGWWARRKGIVTEETASTLSRFVVEIAMPAMIFTGMLRTVSTETLRQNWYLPIVGGLVLYVGLLVATATLPLVKNKSHHATYRFIVSIANWIFLPLPIAKSLYGAAGEQAVLLCNVGATIYLWTMGIYVLQHKALDRQTLKKLALNPGLICTVAGIAIALLIPASRGLENANPDGLNAIALFGSTLLKGMSLIGSLTIPLALIVNGIFLGSVPIKEHRPCPTVGIAILSRLILTPIAVAAILYAITRAGIHISRVPMMVTLLIAAMPVGANCSMVTDCYGGDTTLASRVIFYTTLLSITTVPLLFLLR